MDEIDIRCDSKTYSFFTANWDYVMAMNMLKKGCVDAPKCQKGQVYVKFVRYKKRKLNVSVVTPPNNENEQNSTQSVQNENETVQNENETTNN